MPWQGERTLGPRGPPVKLGRTVVTPAPDDGRRATTPAAKCRALGRPRMPWRLGALLLSLDLLGPVLRLAPRPGPRRRNQDLGSHACSSSAPSAARARPAPTGSSARTPSPGSIPTWHRRARNRACSLDEATLQSLSSPERGVRDATRPNRPRRPCDCASAWTRRLCFQHATAGDERDRML